MSSAYLWVIFAVIASGVELLLGTVYLVAIVFGAVAAALASFMGLTINNQFIFFAAVSALGLPFLHLIKMKITSKVPDAIPLGKAIIRKDLGNGAFVIWYRNMEWKAEWLTPVDSFEEMDVVNVVKIRGVTAIVSAV